MNGIRDRPSAKIRWVAARALMFLDPVLALPTLVAALLLGLIRRAGLQRMPWCRRVLLAVGVLPILDHYYEPQFRFDAADGPETRVRSLPGIDWNASGQLAVLGAFQATAELAGLVERGVFRPDNGSFEAGDGEYWYQFLRLYKPRRLIEVGCGNSTLLAREAIRANRQENPTHQCRHVCIEPYEEPWLETTGAEVVRDRVENVDPALFEELGAGDVLFIDSSHVIKPGGDVPFLYLEILPALKKGVFVHIHDIFSPGHYPRAWLREEIRLWNEQYLVEALLAAADTWKILGALNFLSHQFPEPLQRVCPFWTRKNEPGSIYLQKMR